MSLELPWLAYDNLEFPDISKAWKDPNGLLAVGGDLSVERLSKAYSLGIFPWYEDGQPILWWSPEPRMVLFPQEIHISRSLKKLLRKKPFKITFDQAFDHVVEACSKPRSDEGGTWITEEMKRAYSALFRRNIAHSVEIWEENQLVGGLYGVAIGKAFFGESMFSTRPNASKVALVALTKQLEELGFGFIDCQMETEHLASMGARPISRTEFKQLLVDYTRVRVDDLVWQVTDGSFSN